MEDVAPIEAGKLEDTCPKGDTETSPEFVLVTQEAGFHPNAVGFRMDKFAEDVGVLERHGRHVALPTRVRCDGRDFETPCYPEAVSGDDEYMQTVMRWMHVAEGGPHLEGYWDDDGTFVEGELTRTLTGVRLLRLENGESYDEFLSRCCPSGRYLVCAEDDPMRPSGLRRSRSLWTRYFVSSVDARVDEASVKIDLETVGKILRVHASSGWGYIEWATLDDYKACLKRKAFVCASSPARSYSFDAG